MSLIVREHAEPDPSVSNLPPFLDGAEDPPMTVINQNGAGRGVIVRVWVDSPKQHFFAFELDGVESNTGEPRRQFCAAAESPIRIRLGQEVEITSGRWGIWRDRETGRERPQLKAWRATDFRILDAMEDRDAEACLVRHAPNVGPARAREIVQRFGHQVLERLVYEPEILLEIKGITEETIEKLREVWPKALGPTRIFNKLRDLGIPGEKVRFAILEKWGADCVERVKSRPFDMIRDFRGIGWKIADSVWRLDPDHELDDPLRIEAGIMTALEAQRASGNCWTAPEMLTEKAAELLTLVEESRKVENALGALIARGALISTDCEKIYPPNIYRAEREVEEGFQKLAAGYQTTFPEPPRDLPATGILNEDQFKAIQAIAENRLIVISGLPGTGKTYVIDQIVKLAKTKGLTTILAAPTGKAAARMQEATKHEANTIHSTIQKGIDSETPIPGGPLLDCDLLVLDEASMIDIFLMRDVFRRLDLYRTTLVLVGDVNQLPSVGPGQVLRDLIESEVCPVVFLTEIVRQGADSGIIRLAHKILQGTVPSPEAWDFPGVEYLQTGGRRLTKDRLLTFLETFGDTSGLQILSSRRTKCEHATEKLNPDLSLALNPPAYLEEGGDPPTVRGFRAGDQVIQTANRKALGIFNGDTGIVDSLDPLNKTLTVLFGSGRSIPYSGDLLDDLELAYCLTVHKSQGSEFPVVIFLIGDEEDRVNERALL
jgi:exodeoxyribonuclease V alpha subunit